MQRNCLYCGKEFKTYPSRVKIGKGKYCSKECYFASYSNRKECTCKNCGKEYSVAVSQAGDTYCSRECATEYMHKIGRWEGERELVCSECGETFTRYSGNIKKETKNNYCSQKCYWQSLRISEEKRRENQRRYTRQYRKENPEWYRAQKNKRRARKNGIGGTFTAKEWENLLKENDYRCAMCSEKSDSLTVDHIIPVSKWNDWKERHPDIDYEGNDIENIQPLCVSCNSSKHNKIPTNKDSVRTT